MGLLMGCQYHTTDMLGSSMGSRGPSSITYRVYQRCVSETLVINSFLGICAMGIMLVPRDPGKLQ